MKNHTDLECFRKRKTNISNEIQCYNCNKRGHISRACPNRKRFNVIHRDSDRMEAYETDNASVPLVNRVSMICRSLVQFQLVRQKRRKGLWKIKLLHNEK